MCVNAVFLTRHNAQPLVFASLSKNLNGGSVNGLFKPLGVYGFDCLCNLCCCVGIFLSIQINQKRNIIANCGAWFNMGWILIALYPWATRSFSRVSSEATSHCAVL